MASSTHYYMLVSSLPFLPRIARAERLPINEARLEERLKMLSSEDAEVVDELRRFIQWQNQHPDQTDADVAKAYARLLERNLHPAVQEAIEFRLNLRTILGAMRLRKQGLKEAPADRVWGAGRWVKHIEKYWNHPEFKLNQIYPWIHEARQFLDEGNSRRLEELAMNLVWDALDRSAAGKDFQLEAIVAYLFKWDVLNRWFAYGTEPAREQFVELTKTLFPETLSTAS